jgi:hypothetical protein
MSDAPYGNSLAALTLYKIAKDDKKLRRKIARTLSDYQNHLNSIPFLRTEFSRRYFLHLVYKDFCQRVELDIIKLDNPEVKSYLLNVLDARYKIQLKVESHFSKKVKK